METTKQSRGPPSQGGLGPSGGSVKGSARVFSARVEAVLASRVPGLFGSFHRSNPKSPIFRTERREEKRTERIERRVETVGVEGRREDKRTKKKKFFRRDAEGPPPQGRLGPSDESAKGRVSTLSPLGSRRPWLGGPWASLIVSFLPSG